MHHQYTDTHTPEFQTTNTHPMTRNMMPNTQFLFIIVTLCFFHHIRASDDCSIESTDNNYCFTTTTTDIEEEIIGNARNTTSSSNNNNNKWRWDLDNARCNIRRITLDQLWKEFGKQGIPPLYHEPIIIYDTAKNHHNHVFRQLCRHPSKLLHQFPPNFQVTLSSSNSFSAHRRTIPLTQYIQESVWDQPETYPNQLLRSNETWYLFGETYSPEWKDFLTNYTLPPCHTCIEELVALSFGIGNRGSGVQWHVHGPGFSEAISGRKHWVLYPPKVIPNYNPDQTSRNWMEYTYTNLPKKDMPHECTLDPGDIIYFPNHWYHATINLDPYTVFVSTFTTEHQF
mmetsp:Transcript_569/g.1002  ORF Transcript_569/g.1002 Transcript_569/m.1002 type:complete len:341 (-) Transcript_569:597-1619(-)